MAKNAAVWGIDIGQSALKALRCRPHESDKNRVVVEAFDYIEYPKLLSQPDADREELIREALETFLSRNEIKGDRVAMSVPGQSGLSRFIKLPPVEAKKIPDIVKYEARQQIPFTLEDVVWDYEPLAGGSQDEGFALETEIGLFAMKRDQVAGALEPLTQAGIEIDFIQLAPLAVYNFACFDRMPDLDDATFNPAEPPPSTVVLSIGVDTTDLVITNGFRVWLRNIPIGGSHFTKALTKELKLTFAKAEHLKKNATQAEDPKAVFQAMRPVFSDLVAEIQRSIGFFNSNNREAKLSEVIALGNAMKLPGLQRYLAQNLDIPVKPIDEFNALVGGSVTATPEFEKNRLSFPVAYGLCVQALGLSRISTNLLPEELVTQRIIRAKKPWAVAAAAVLMIGMAANYASHVGAWQTVDLKKDWNSPIQSSKSESQRVTSYESKNSELRSKFEEIALVGENLQSNVDGRLLWLELLKVIDAAMPRDERPLEARERTAKDVTARPEVHITTMDCQKFEELGEWFSQVQPLYEDAQKTQAEKLADEREAAKAAKAAEAAAGEGETMEGEEEAGLSEEDGLGSDGFEDGEEMEGEGGTGPSGPGWVIQLVGYHFHNDGDNLEGEQFVNATLLKNLAEGSIQLPDGPGGEMVEVSFKELGVNFPVVVTRNRINEVEYDPEANSEEGAVGGRRRGGGRGMGMRGPSGERGSSRKRPGRAAQANKEAEPEFWKLRRYDFIVQFCWTPTPRHVRQENRESAANEEGAERDDFAAN